LLAGVSVLVAGLSAYLGAGPENETVKVRLRLLDADTGAPVAGIVRVYRDGQDQTLPLPGLYNRLRGLEREATTAGWHVVPAPGVETALPRGKLRLEAVAGLETALARQEIELRNEQDVTIKLRYLFRPEKEQLVAGNTHLHLMKLTRADADEYLRQIPAADGLKVMFISHLKRVPDDVNYITNEYPIGALKQFDMTGVLFNNGEEHRHNFQGYGQGYGHVMLLNINKLIEPVSIGPGIMGAGFDDLPLTPGIAEARRQGGTIIWCHNTNGHEDVVNALAGRLDALNVFDGSRTGDFGENYYKYLNIGLPMPISTGTDWFMYDFSRVYARVTGKLTIPSWLDAVKAGRCVATNGPLLNLTVDGRPIGDTLKLDKPKTVRIEATGLGRHDFQRLQLVHNGKVLHEQAAAKKDDAYEARLVRDVPLDGPGWFAVRIDSTTRNEFDKPLYAHGSPVYVEVGGQRVFDPEAARGLLKQLEEGQAEIRAKAKFSNPAAADRLLALYQQAAKELASRSAERGR
jgi:hypothetical protein